MTWEWSHSPDAIDAAAYNLSKLPMAELKDIAREWAHHDREARGIIRQRAGSVRPAGFRLPSSLARASRDALITWIWERMEAHRTCDTGGFRAYACLYGCHTVPFDDEKVSHA